MIPKIINVGYGSVRKVSIGGRLPLAFIGGPCAIENRSHAFMMADRIGKIEVATLAMLGSGAAALATAATYGWAPWLTFVLVLFWGATVIADSAQFSALIADASPPHLAGSLLTFQTAIGFALTIFTVQVTPVVASLIGWPLLLCVLAIGPAFGVAAMWGMRGKAQ